MHPRRNLRLNELEFKRRALVGKLLGYSSASRRLEELRVLVYVLSLIEFQYEDATINDDGILTNNLQRFALFHLVAELEWNDPYSELGKLLQEERALLEEYSPGLLNRPELREFALEIIKVDKALCDEKNNQLMMTKDKPLDWYKEQLRNFSFIKLLKDAISNKKAFIGLNHIPEEQIQSVCRILQRLNITTAIVTSSVKSKVDLNSLFEFLHQTKLKSLAFHFVHFDLLEDAVNMKAFWSIVGKSTLQELRMLSKQKVLTPSCITALCEGMAHSKVRLLEVNCHQPEGDLLEGNINNFSIIATNQYHARVIASEIFERGIIPTEALKIVLARNGLIFDVSQIREILNKDGCDEKTQSRIEQLQFKIEKLRHVFKEGAKLYRFAEIDKAEFLMLRDVAIIFLEKKKDTTALEPLLEIPPTSTYYLRARMEAFVIGYNGFYQMNKSPLNAFMNALNYCVVENKLIDFKEEQKSFDGFLCGAVDIKKPLGEELGAEARLNLLQYVSLKYALELLERLEKTTSFSSIFQNNFSRLRTQLAALPNVVKVPDLEELEIKKKINELWLMVDELKKALPKSESDFVMVLEMVSEEIRKLGAGPSLT